HVRVQVMLDLVAQVPGQDVEETAAFEVRRARELAEIPGAAALVASLLFAVDAHTVGEMAAEDDRERPDVTDQVGGEVAGQHAWCIPQRKRREERVVFEDLPAGFAQERTRPLRQLRERALPLEEVFVEAQIVRADTPLEGKRESQRVEGLAEVERRPALLFAHAQD